MALVEHFSGKIHFKIFLGGLTEWFFCNKMKIMNLKKDLLLEVCLTIIWSKRFNGNGYGTRMTLAFLTIEISVCYAVHFYMVLSGIKIFQNFKLKKIFHLAIEKCHRNSCKSDSSFQFSKVVLL